MKFLVPILIIFAASRSTLHSEPDPHFTHSVTTDKKPWTKRAFRNDPNHFQFAIVTDRTGGLRPGVFPRAVKMVNELQPEFVITVGDLITGGGRQRNEKEIRRQWDEFNGFVEGFEMPFFYLPGNHDVSNDVMDRIWDEQFGVRYYSFVYKGVLFVCLNTQDGEGWKPSLGDEQIAWAKQELTKHPDVRWTMVFIHQPLWLMEEGIKRNDKGKTVIRKTATGWPEMEQALHGRKHTVYAGHVHHYAKYERNEANYYTLGTTGGGNRMRGNSFGEFDHATWITMTDDGPRMMNLTLDGMLEDDISTEAHQTFWRALQFSEHFRQTYPLKDKVVTVPLESSFKGPISGRLTWQLPSADNWSVSPRRIAVNLKPGEKKEVKFTVSYQGEVDTYFPLPLLNTHFHGAEDKLHLTKALYLPLDIMDHAKKHPVKTTTTATDQEPDIDGRLDDTLWQAKPTIAQLIPRKADGYSPMDTETWIRHDDAFLYLAIRCHDTQMRDILSEATERDGEVRLDDSVEIVLDTNHDKKTYHHFAVNSAGTLYDGRRNSADWNSTAKVATTTGENGWNLEMAIPLKEIGADLSAHQTWGLQIARNRPRMEEMKAYQWAPTFWFGNYLPSLFGELKFQ